jgi:hypothetical protein
MSEENITITLTDPHSLQQYIVQAPVEDIAAPDLLDQEDAGEEAQAAIAAAQAAQQD